MNKREDGRARLPDERATVGRKFVLGEIKGYVQVGFYPCGCPGELFIRCGHEGDLVRGLLDGFATMFSIALQHGARPQTLIEKCLHTRFPPEGFTLDPDHPNASSLLDYIGALVKGIIADDHAIVVALRTAYGRANDSHGSGEAGVSED